MKKTIIALALAALPFVGGTSFAYASGPSGNITVNGLISESNCDVDFSEAENVVMPEINSKTLTGKVGQVSQLVGTSISFSGCPSSVTSAALVVDGDKDINNQDLLANTTSPGAATGVGIEFLSFGGKALPVGQTSEYTQLVDGAGSIPLSIRYRSVLNKVTGGKVSATGQINILYK